MDFVQEQRALFDELFEQAPQAAALLNAGRRIVRVNREFTRIFGYAPAEALGRRLEDLIVPEEVREEVQRSPELAARGRRVHGEGVRCGKDGRQLHVSVIGVPVSVPGGEVAVYVIYRDITDRKMAERELQRSFEELRALAARLQNIREDERARLAREIHDRLGQALTSIRIDLTALRRELPHGDNEHSRRADSILKLMDETLQSVRRIATELRPGILDDLGLVAAVEWAAEEFQTHTGIKCHVSLPDPEIALDPQRATALFRILQETLTNVARHANATAVDVRLGREDGDLVLEVHDNGTGFDERRIPPGRALGIVGMRERALLLGGAVAIGGAAGRGTTVRVRIPEPRQRTLEPGS